MRLLLIATLAGCSLISIAPLPPGYNGHTEPRCDVTQLPIILDVLSGALDVIAIISIAARYDTVRDADSGLFLFGSDAALSFVSAGAGVRWTGACESARRAWDTRAVAPAAAVAAGVEHDPSDSPFKTWSYWCQIDGNCVADLSRCRAPCIEKADVFCVYYLDAERERFSCTTTRDGCLDRRAGINGRDLGECVAQHARLESPSRIAPIAAGEPKTPTAAPRGFFCVSSPTVVGAGLCVREKDTCKDAREAALAAVGDLTECALVETAWCSGERCAATKDDCITRQQRAGSGAPECVETK